MKHVELTWKVKIFNFNTDILEDYDVLKHREDFFKKLIKKSNSKEDFSAEVRKEMMYHYWSKTEWELIIKIDEAGRVWLEPWVGRNPEDSKVDVTEDKNFDWVGFAKKHIARQIFKNEAKVDVYSQLEWAWDEFITYLWNQLS